MGFAASQQLVVADTKGATTKVQWTDVDAIAKREAVIVRAITMQAYSEREMARQRKEPFEPCWLPATVLMAVLDPMTKRIDGFHIRQSNGQELLSAGPGIVHVDDYVKLVQMACDGAMPVLRPVPCVPRLKKPEGYKPPARPAASHDRNLEALTAAETQLAQLQALRPEYVANDQEARKISVEAYHYRPAARTLLLSSNGRDG